MYILVFSLLLLLLLYLTILLLLPHLPYYCYFYSLRRKLPWATTLTCKTSSNSRCTHSPPRPSSPSALPMAAPAEVTRRGTALAISTGNPGIVWYLLLLLLIYYDLFSYILYPYIYIYIYIYTLILLQTQPYWSQESVAQAGL